MQIRTRLTLQFTAIFAITLLIFLLVIYFFTSIHRQNEFYNRTYSRARISARFFLDKDEHTDQQKKKYQKLFYQSLPKEVIQIYNSQNEIIIREGTPQLTINPRVLETIREKKYIQFTENDRQLVGLFYPDNQGDFVVIASSVDVYSLEKMRHLRAILIIGFLIFVILVFYIGWNFAKQSLKPFRKMVREVEKINASDLHHRLSYSDGTDEVADLAGTFNNMLNRLELAFDMQNTFISNASHELRTPLTAIIGEIEVALLNKRSTEEYEKVLHSILDDASRLANLSNGLLQIAKASFDLAKIKLVNVRFDEVVWQAFEEIQRRHSKARFDIQFINLPDDESKFIVRGNEPLLLIAMLNILENAVKFSPSEPIIELIVKIERSFVSLHVLDQGLGISQSDLKNVFVPFWRADNVRNIYGHGIGLPLTERIMHLHKGKIEVRSRKEEGTEVVIRLPQSVYQIP